MRLVCLAQLLLAPLITSVLGAGDLWPKPQSQTHSSHRLSLDPAHFSFRIKGYSSSILLNAFDRYTSIIFGSPLQEMDLGLERKHKPHDIRHLDVYVYSFDQSLNLDTDESYTLALESPVSVLQCHTVYGALRGLETLSQLIEKSSAKEERHGDPAPSSGHGAEGAQSLLAYIQQIGYRFWVMVKHISAETRQYVSASLGQVTAMPVEVASKDMHSRTDSSGTASVAEEDAKSDTKSAPLATHRQTSRLHGDPAEQHSQRLSQADMLAYQLALHDQSFQPLPFLKQNDDKVNVQDNTQLSMQDRHNNQHSHLAKHHKEHHKRHRKHRERVVYTVNATAISDAPRFQHRGLLLDTSRHFLPVQNIKDHLDAMAWSKMNVFHWHIVDDQSFPFESQCLPGLSRWGAFSQKHVYSRQDVSDIIAYAKDRGIRVIPEFDTPGHVASWGKGHPELLTPCFDPQGHPTGQLGPLNPVKNSTYSHLWLLLREVAQVFPDSYLHLGGDEVPFDCWQSNPDVQEWMKSNGLESLSQLEGYFEERVLDLAAQAGRSYIVWQDVLDNNVTLRDDTVVHVWKWWPTNAASASHSPHSTHSMRSMNSTAAKHASQYQATAAADAATPDELTKRPQNTAAEQLLHAHGPPHGLSRDKPRGCKLSRGCPGEPRSYSGEEEPGWFPEMEKVTAKGYRALLSSPWYLNLGQYYGDDWAQYYAVEPHAFKGSRRQHDLVMGGEACMWGEFTDATNSISATWPRAAAVAERLWSDKTVRDRDDAEKRLHQHRCRMLARGLPAQPLGPGFCPQDVDF